jgi:hypothetical protein
MVTVVSATDRHRSQVLLGSLMKMCEPSMCEPSTRGRSRRDGTGRDGRTVFLAADDEVAPAFSAASPRSIPIAIEGLVPQPAAVVTS